MPGPVYRSSIHGSSGYGTASSTWIWWSGGAIVLLAGGFLLLRRLGRPKAAASPRFRMPERLTPFTVLGLLRNIERNDGLGDDDRKALAAEIARIERWHFEASEGDPPDLARIAESWVVRARPRS